MVILKINVYYDHIWDRILGHIFKKNFILVLKTKEFNLKQNEEKAVEAV